MVYVTCSKTNKNITLYKPIRFVSEFHYMSNSIVYQIYQNIHPGSGIQCESDYNSLNIDSFVDI